MARGATLSFFKASGIVSILERYSSTACIFVCETRLCAKLAPEMDPCPQRHSTHSFPTSHTTSGESPPLLAIPGMCLGQHEVHDVFLAVAGHVFGAN
jgi:hypothetical protein